MYDGIVELSLIYRCEAWVLRGIFCGIFVESEGLIEFRMLKLERCGKIVGVGERMDRGVLRWFGHVERMGEERLARKV